MRPRLSNEMLTGWRIIGSLATQRAEKPSGSFIRLTASSGVNPWAEAVAASARRTGRASAWRCVMGTPCYRRHVASVGRTGRPVLPGIAPELQDVPGWGELQAPNG